MKDLINDMLLFPLQFFAEGKDEGIDEAKEEKVDTQPEDKSKEETNEDYDNEVKTFTQEEVDKIVKERLSRVKKNTFTQDDIEKIVKDRLDEAEKLKNMNAKDKADYEKQKLEAEINQLRAEKVRYGLEKEASTMLADKKITADETILSFVVKEDADKTKEAVEKFTALMDELVNKAVKEALRQDTPKSNNSTNKTKTEAELIAEQFNNKNKVKENPYF